MPRRSRLAYSTRPNGTGKNLSAGTAWVGSSLQDDDGLVGFVNVPWDGFKMHAWIQDAMVATRVRGQGIGTELVAVARDRARDAGCEWLHVDFDDHLRPFYFDACGFTATICGFDRPAAMRPSEEIEACKRLLTGECSLP